MSTAQDNWQFRNVLGVLPTDVTIITSHSAEGGALGLSATSFNSVSLDPCMVSWSVDPKSSNAEAFYHVASFAVHVLSSDQEQAGKQLSRTKGGRRRSPGLRWPSSFSG